MKYASIVWLVLICASCGTESNESNTSSIAAHPYYVVSAYEICDVDMAKNSKVKMLEDVLHPGNSICVSLEEPLIGIEPKIFRISTIGGGAWQFIVACEKPETERWKVFSGKASRLTLVSEGKALGEYRRFGGELDGGHCGFFNPPTKEDAIKTCEHVLTAWGQDISACSKSCEGLSGTSRKVCIQDESYF